MKLIWQSVIITFKLGGQCMSKLVRIATLYAGFATTIFGFHTIERPILFLIGLAILVTVGETVFFSDGTFLSE